MLTLRTSPTSPFVRKARIAAALCGLTGRIREQPSDTLDAKDSVRGQNPLGKIPVLLTEDGQAIFDSRVILEYFDELAGGGRILPRQGAARIEALRLQALADGIMDAAILQIYESRFRPQERHEPGWLEHQAGKVARALDALERAPPALEPMLHVGHIALACALGYLDFRFGGRWRADHPRLADWLDAFAWKVPAFAESRPPQ
jgi:glutathione S-transferase